MRLMNFFTAFSCFCGFTIGVCLCAAGLSPFSGYASATAVAAWANIVLGAWALLVAVIAALLAVAVLWLLAWLGWLSVLLLCVLLLVALLWLLLCVLLLVTLLRLLFVAAWCFFLTLVWLVWLALVRSLVAVFLSAGLGTVLSGLAVFAVTASVVSSVCAFLLRLVKLDVFRTFAASLRERHFVYHLLQELLYLLEPVLVFFAHEGDGSTIAVGTGSTADAVNVSSVS